MKFRLLESTEYNEEFEGWAQEDIELYESIDWDEQGDNDYDAGCAYLDSAVFCGEDIDRETTEFHKFISKDPTKKPYYKPIEKLDITEGKDCEGPISSGRVHKDYDILNRYIEK